jgi:hypothetical protein
VWAARLFAIMFLAVTIDPLLRTGGPNWGTVVVLLVLAAALVVAAQLMSRGSRTAACLALGLFVLVKLSDWLLVGNPLWAGLIWTIIFLGALGNGVWGTFSLVAVKRDAVSVPPGPERAVRAPTA